MGVVALTSPLFFKKRRTLPMSEQQVIISIENGVAQMVESITGIKVLIMDYDIEASDWDGMDIKTDKDGNQYQLIEL